MEYPLKEDRGYISGNKDVGYFLALEGVGAGGWW